MTRPRGLIDPLFFKDPDLPRCIRYGSGIRLIFESALPPGSIRSPWVFNLYPQSHEFVSAHSGRGFPLN